MTTDPSYGGELKRHGDGWQLNILVDFKSDAIMPIELLVPNRKVGYRIYKAPAQSITQVNSPSETMILELGPENRTEDAYVYIADGYDGWPVKNPTKTIVEQHYIQVGLMDSELSPNPPLKFSLEFHFEDDSLNAANLELWYRQTPTTPDYNSNPVTIRDVADKPNTVVSDPVSQSGYYALMKKR